MGGVVDILGKIFPGVIKKLAQFVYLSICLTFGSVPYRPETPYVTGIVMSVACYHHNAPCWHLYGIVGGHPSALAGIAFRLT